MCGRYALAGDFSELTTEFALEETPGLSNRYNIAPSYSAGNEAPIVTSQGLIFARFWYIPETFDAALRALPTAFNARLESLSTKPFFRGARPCLVPTSGFREFPGTKGHKRAICFYKPTEPSTENTSFEDPPSFSFFAFGGIRSTWKDPTSGEVVETFAIITTRPSALVEQYHDRMPLIIPSKSYTSWLAPAAKLEHLVGAAEATAHELHLACYEAETFGNNTRVEGPECIQRKRAQLSLY